MNLGDSVQFQTLILTLTVFVGGGIMLMFGHGMPDGTSQAIFALWGAAATNAFNARAASQSAANAGAAAASGAAQTAAATVAAALAATAPQPPPAPKVP